jgi:hypothetical protein
MWVRNMLDRLEANADRELSEVKWTTEIGNSELALRKELICLFDCWIADIYAQHLPGPGCRKQVCSVSDSAAEIRNVLSGCPMSCEEVSREVHGAIEGGTEIFRENAFRKSPHKVPDVAHPSPLWDVPYERAEIADMADR